MMICDRFFNLAFDLFTSISREIRRRDSLRHICMN